MKSFKLLAILTLTFTISFFLGLIGKVIYEKSTIHPYEWEELPILVNCYGKGFNETKIIRAIDYWAVRGYNIGFYEHNPPKSVCDNKIWIYGMIIIRKAKPFQLDATTLASTRRYTAINKMKGAEIVYSPGSFELTLINEHELGHALGFTHIEIEGHIMYPIFEKMGKDFYIP